LLDAYAEDDFSLDHLMAFTVSDDHARQQQVYNALKARPYGIQPHEICRMLTEGAVPADDRRVKFIGIDAYAAAGGVIIRDLFTENDDGWLQDAELLDRLVAEKLQKEADAVAAEG